MDNPELELELWTGYSHARLRDYHNVSNFLIADHSVSRDTRRPEKLYRRQRKIDDREIRIDRQIFVDESPNHIAPGRYTSKARGRAPRRNLLRSTSGDLSRTDRAEMRIIA